MTFDEQLDEAKKSLIWVHGGSGAVNTSALDRAYNFVKATLEEDIQSDDDLIGLLRGTYSDNENLKGQIVHSNDFDNESLAMTVRSELTQRKPAADEIITDHAYCISVIDGDDIPEETMHFTVSHSRSFDSWDLLNPSGNVAWGSRDYDSMLESAYQLFRSFEELLE